MKNKGFTLVELIIVVAILSMIMLIGVPAFAHISKRMRVRSDKASAHEIGKALTVREGLVPDEKKLEYYPVITRYDKIDGIATYVSAGHRPQSMRDGYYFATALKIGNAKKILVGIGKEEMPVTNVVYNGPNASGWVYIESGKIDEFLDTNSGLLSEAVQMPDNYENEEQKADAENSEVISLKVGAYVEYIPPAGDYSVDANGTTSSYSRTNEWQVFNVNGDKIALISSSSVGSLTLGGKDGYANNVGILNEIASKYVDNRFISGARGLGASIGISEDRISTPITFEDSVVAIPYEDDTHRSDVSIIADNPELQIDEVVWLASRYIIKNEDTTQFAIRCLPTNSRALGYSLYIAKSDKTGEPLGEKTFGVRPVIYLAPGVTLGDGDGTKYKPYKLHIES